MFRLSLGALALAAALVTPLAASAQTAPVAPPVGPGAAGANAPMARHHHHRQNGYMRAMRGLNLSDAQKQQIAGIMKSAHAARKSAAAGGTPVDPQTRRANMLALRQQIDGVLSDTQRAQLHANLKAQRHQRMQQQPQGGGSG